jgi:hypothetical protein
VDPSAGLDDIEKLKFLTYQDSNSDPSVVQPVASRYADYATAAHTIYEGTEIIQRDVQEEEITARIRREMVQMPVIFFTPFKEALFRLETYTGARGSIVVKAL